VSCSPPRDVPNSGATEPLPTDAVEAVLAADGSFAGRRAVGRWGDRCHGVGRAVQAVCAVVRRLDAWMVADEAGLVGVLGQVLERAGLSWPPRDRARVVDGCGLDRDADALSPSGPEAENRMLNSLVYSNLRRLLTFRADFQCPDLFFVPKLRRFAAPRVLAKSAVAARTASGYMAQSIAFRHPRVSVVEYVPLLSGGTSRGRQKGKQSNAVAVRAQHHESASLDLRRMSVQDLDEGVCRVGRQKAMRAEQNHAGRTAAGEREDPAEVEIVGQQYEPVPPRPLEDLSVGSRAVTDLAPVAGLDARVRQRLDPPRRQVHVDQELQLEPTATSCSSLRHAA